MAKILHVVHQFPPAAMGGVEVHTLELASAQRDRGHQPVVLHAARQPGRPQYALERTSHAGLRVVRMVQNYPYRPLAEETWDPGAARRLGEVIAEVGADVIHFQHLWGWSAAALQAAVEADPPTVLTLHDHWLACPAGGQRYRADRGVCVDLASSPCETCYAGFRAVEGPLERLALRWARVLPRPLPPDLLHRTFARLPGRARTLIKRADARAPRRPAAAEAGSAEARRARFAALLARVDALVSPSRDLAHLTTELGLDADAIRLVPNATSMASEGVTPPPGLDGARPLRLLFLGTPAPHKGVHVLAEAVARVRGAVQLVVRGAPPAPAYRDVLQAAGARLELGGPVPREQVARVIDHADLVCMPSLWPENAPLVLLEARARGRPVLASDLGGIPETAHGLLLPPGDAAAWTDAVQRLVVDRGQLARLAADVPPPRHTEALVDDVDRLYRELGVPT